MRATSSQLARFVKTWAAKRGWVVDDLTRDPVSDGWRLRLSGPDGDRFEFQLPSLQEYEREDYLRRTADIMDEAMAPPRATRSEARRIAAQTDQYLARVDWGKATAGPFAIDPVLYTLDSMSYDTFRGVDRVLPTPKAASQTLEEWTAEVHAVFKEKGVWYAS